MKNRNGMYFVLMAILLVGCGDDLEVEDPLSGAVQDREWEFADGHALPKEDGEEGETVEIMLSDQSLQTCEEIEEDGTYVAFEVPPKVGVHEDVPVDFVFVEGFDFGFSGTTDTVEITRVEDSIIFGELEVSTEGTDLENDIAGEFAAHLCGR